MTYRKYKVDFTESGSEVCVVEAPCPGVAIEYFLACHGMMGYDALPSVTLTNEPPDDEYTESEVRKMFAKETDQQLLALNEHHSWKEKSLTTKEAHMAHPLIKTKPWSSEIAEGDDRNVVESRPVNKLLAKSRKELFTPKPVQLKGRFWDLYKHGLTASAIDRWLLCREQFRLVYVEGYSSHNTSMALEFGTCVHWVLEQVYSSKSTLLPTNKMIADLVLEYEQFWLTQVTAPTQAQLDQQQMVYGMAEATLPSYFRRYDGDLTGKYKFKLEGVDAPTTWLKLEETFEFPYKLDGVTITLRGKRDGVFLNKNKRRFVFDTKTKGQINEETIAGTLKANFQQMFYLWVEYQQDELPHGVQMNIYRRPQLRQGKTEDLADFIERVRLDVSNPERFDHYFTRIQMTVEKHDLDVWHDTVLRPVLQGVRQWFESESPHYATHAALSTYGPCDVYGAILNDDLSGLYKRKLVFPELPEATFN